METLQKRLYQIPASRYIELDNEEQLLSDSNQQRDYSSMSNKSRRTNFYDTTDEWGE